MADPRSIYNQRPGERGWATILPDAPVAFSGAVGMAMRQRQNRAKAADAAIKGLNKTYDTWRIYSKQLESLRSSFLNEVFDALRKGDATAASMLAAQRAQQLANFANNGKQVGEVVQQLIKQASSDPRINTDEFSRWLIRSQLYNEDGTLKDPSDVPVEEFTLERLMEMPGASAWLDKARVLRSVADDLFRKQDVEETLNTYKVSGLSNGFYFFNRERAKGKIRPYEFIDKTNRELKVKPPEQLLQEGFVNDFMEDPVAARVLIDEARSKYNDDGPEALAKALYDMLNHRSLHDGRINIIKDEQIRESPWVGAGAGTKKEIVIDPLAVTVAQAFNGSLPGTLTSLEDVKDALPVQLPDSQLRGFVDVTEAFGGASQLATLLKPFYHSDIKGDTKTLPASRIYSNPDVGLLVVEYADEYTGRRYYKAFSPQGAARGTAPAYQLFYNLKSGQRIIENLKKAGVIDNNNNFLFDKLADPNPNEWIQPTGPMSGVAGKVGAREEAMAPLMGDKGRLPVQQGLSVAEMLNDPETAEAAVTRLREELTGTVVDYNGKTAKVTDIYIQPPSSWESFKDAIPSMFTGKSSKDKTGYIIVELDDGSMLRFNDGNALINYFRDRIPIRRR